MSSPSVRPRISRSPRRPLDVGSRVRLQDTEVLAKHLAEWPVGDAPAVGEAASRATQWLGPFVSQLLPEFANQPSLADACVPCEGDKPGTALLSHPMVGIEQSFEFSLAPDEGSAESRDPARARQRERSDEPTAGHTSALARCLQRHGLGEFEGAAGSSDRTLAHEDLSWSGSLLKTCGDVDGVARDKRAALARTAHHHVTGVHADPDDELLCEQRFELPPHRQRRMESPFGMVLIGVGRTE